MGGGFRLGVGGWVHPAVTWWPGGPIWSAAVGEGGAGLWLSPSGLGWAGVLQCLRLCWLASVGGNSSRGLHSGARGGGPWFSWVCAGGVCGPLGGSGVLWGVGLPSVGVCGLSSVGGGEGCLAGGSVAGVCCCLGGSERPMSRGPGVRAMVGVCGSPGGQREGRGMGGVGASGCVVSVYVSARSGAPAWSVVGRAVWRKSLPSSAAAAKISQTRLRIWWTHAAEDPVDGVVPAGDGLLWSGGGGGLPRIGACLDLCVGGGDGPEPGHGLRGWPAALDPLGQAEHCQPQVVARFPSGDLDQGAGWGLVPRLEYAPEDLLRSGGVPYCPWWGGPWGEHGVCPLDEPLRAGGRSCSGHYVVVPALGDCTPDLWRGGVTVCRWGREVVV